MKTTHQKKYNIVEFINEILKKDPFFKTHILKMIRYVGSSSIPIHPISIYEGGKNIVLLWKSNREPKAWIKEMILKSNGLLTQGYFLKSDGSCPNEIKFFYE